MTKKKVKVKKLEPTQTLNKKTVQKKKTKNKKKGNYAKNEKYPALNAKRQVYNRREQIEGDYYHLLNEEEKEWLNSFLSETVVTNFKHAGPELYPDQEDKRQFYRDNNARNRCMYNRAKSFGLLSNVEDIVGTLDRQEMNTPDEIEDLFLTAITIKRQLEAEAEKDKEPEED